ncbi:MAG: choice-of-anchor J domain-containing protein [Chitinophagaceae bacterium]|nr:choice-of-anchor J domain-containing protein [Chitinophagaceae bacterium]
MRKKLLRNVLAFSGLAVVLFQSCKDDSKLTVPVSPTDQSFTESFDNFSEAASKGWVAINKSTPMGAKWYDVAEVPNLGSPNYVSIYYPNWEQAQFTLDSAQFPNAPFPGRYWNNAFFSQRASNGYAATSIACAEVINFRGGSVPFNVNSWLVSPQMTIKNGDKISFYTYSKGVSSLQLFVNAAGSLNVGDGLGNNTGDFNIKLVDIPNFAANPHATYPTEWTKFEGEVKGLNKPVQGRFGFRYFLQNQSPLRFSLVDPNDIDTFYTQIHKTVVGVDEVSFKSAQ